MNILVKLKDKQKHYKLSVLKKLVAENKFPTSAEFHDQESGQWYSVSELTTILKDKINIKRKEILPQWIRFGSWLFLIFYLTPVIFIIGLFDPIRVGLFGYHYYGTSIHIFPVLACLYLLFTAITAHFILWGKDLGVIFGIICGILGILISISAMFYSFSNGFISIRLEPIFQIPFVITLIKKKKEWDDF